MARWLARAATSARTTPSRRSTSAPEAADLRDPEQVVAIGDVDRVGADRQRRERLAGCVERSAKRNVVELAAPRQRRRHRGYQVERAPKLVAVALERDLGARGVADVTRS